ncbi:MAG TPA: ABC transporter substrate-binding protein [Chloroflexota bacterium]|nr:ABC transporter substrate-binding protein [Chloroflexota bacterium]
MPRRVGLASCLLVALTVACQAAAPAPSRSDAAPPPAAAPSAGAPAATSPAQPPASLQKINVAILSTNELQTIPWVAKDSGIFARHGFDAEVSVVAGSPRVTQSLIAGDFDYAIAGVSSLIRARIQGADPMILATSSNTLGSFNVLVAPDSGIHTLQDLRGQTVGVTQLGSDADVFLHLALECAGLSANDVTIVQHGGSPQGVAAVASGGLQAAVVGGPSVLVALRTGLVSIAAARDMHILSLSGTIAATRRHIERDRAEVVRFMRAYVEAIHFFKTQRAATIQMLQAHNADLPADEASYIYDEVVDVFQPLPMPSDEALEAVIARETEPGMPRLTPDDVADRSVLRDIERSGFVQDLYK